MRNLLKTKKILLLAAIVASVLLLIKAKSENTVKPDNLPDKPLTSIGTARQQKADKNFNQAFNSTVSNVRPTKDWSVRIFDGQPEKFSSADFAIARNIVTKYLANYQKIDSLEFHLNQEKRIIADADSVGMKLLAMKLNALSDRNKGLDIKITRSTLHTKGKSLASYYIDGEMWFFNYALLSAGDSVRQNVTFDMQLPELDDLITQQHIRDAKYCVIEDIKSDAGVVNSYWFNNETGMLDLLITHNLKSDDRHHASGGASVFCYEKINGVYYPVRWRRFSEDWRVREDGEISNLKLSTSPSR